MTTVRPVVLYGCVVEVQSGICLGQDDIVAHQRIVRAPR